MPKITEMPEGKTQEELDAEAGSDGVTQVDDDQQQSGEQTDDDQQQGARGEDSAEQVVVTIGDADPEEDEHAKTPAFIQLRDAHREAIKKTKDLERKLAAVEGAKSGEPTLGAKPKLADADYDTDKHEADLDAWYAKKAEVDAANRKKQETKEAAAAAWQQKLDGYSKTKTEFKARASDFDTVELEVQNALSATQQGIIVNCSKNAATLIYGLGKNSEKLKELAAITDPAQFTWQIAQLETQLKVSNRQAPPPPERGARGTVAVGSGSDAQLARLRAAAEKSGDFTQVIAYKRSMKKTA